VNKSLGMKIGATYDPCFNCGRSWPEHIGHKIPCDNFVTDCGKCHTCDRVLWVNEHEDDQFCAYCKEWRYYASHGWSGETFTDETPCKAAGKEKA
jgi:uncharacterized CHY-type Zn-finger protein